MLLTLLVFAALALAAIAFACWPLFRKGQRALARMVLAAALAAVVCGIGAGAYLMVGAPGLAARSFADPSAKDLPALVALLAQRVRERPHDVQAWILLGRGYLTLNDPADAAAAFKRAILAAAPQERPALYSAYAEALTLSAGGAVTPEAEAAFRAALASHPKDFGARYYLGLAYASRRDNKDALALWQSLLADAPPGAPWRAELVDRIAALTSQSGGAPDVRQMVASLAARLKAQPSEPGGWQRLIRAYAVLGQVQEARRALAQARHALRNNPDAQAQLGAEARNLRLEE